jgi:hypothetical protein
MAPQRRNPTTKHDVAIARLSAKTKIRLIDRGAGVLRTALRWAGSVWVALEVKEAIEKIAEGHVSVGGILLSLLNGKTERWILVGVAAICAGIAIRERRARRDVTKGQGERIRELEAKLDPERSSSRLLADGRARKDGEDDEP